MKRKRIIDVLRKTFPDVTWHYEWPSTWKCSAGWGVTGYSALNGGYEGDESSHTEYRRSDTGEVVYGLEHGNILAVGFKLL